jgi:hypothetical protein
MYQVPCTKYGIRVIGCFLSSSKFFNQRSAFDINFQSVFRISYLGFLFPTLYLVLGTLYFKKLFSPPNVLPSCFFDPLGGVVDVLPEEEVQLPYMVLHMSEVVEDDFENGIIHGFGFIDPPLGGELLIQT